jgi:negative regulator of sigma E activity
MASVVIAKLLLSTAAGLGLLLALPAFGQSEVPTATSALDETPAWVAQDVPSLLNRMLSPDSRGLRATIIYSSPQQLRTIKLESDAAGLRAFSLDGPELTRNYAQRAPLSEQLRAAMTQQLQRSYQIAVLSRTRIANRMAIELRFTPTDGWRYGQQLWLDLESGIALRSELLDARNQLLESMLVTEFELAAGTAKVEQNPELAPSFRVINLPSGFTLVRSKASAQGQHQVYSDGLAQVSVFVNQKGQSVSGQQRRGVLAIVSKRIMSPQGEREIVVLGDVPEPTIERFASGVTLEP